MITSLISNFSKAFAIFFLYRYAVDYFGKHSWYNVPTALKAVQTSNLDDDTKELVAAYIEAQDEPELTDIERAEYHQ